MSVVKKTNELEKLVNKTNLKYKKLKEALILKVPVPIVYTNNGLVAQQSTVDYTGLIKDGTYIAFDAKECNSSTSFPLSNIHEHQLLYLQFVKDLKGISFFLIWFKKLNKMFVTPINLVSKYWNNEGRKSIPIKDFKEEWLVDINDYLNTIQFLKNEIMQ